MEKETPHKVSVLIIYYSLSSQSKNILQALALGLESQQCQVAWERIEPEKEIRFPAGSYFKAVLMMTETFFRKRDPIKPLSDIAYGHYDVIILSGPTWSFHPSGPVLSLFKQYGVRVFSGKKVMAVISCRRYWRFHRLSLHHLVKKCGGILVNSLVFTHSGREPWSTIGVFLKLVGKVPESRRWFSRYYPKYGHRREQMAEAQHLGETLGQQLSQGNALANIAFDITVPGIINPAGKR